MRKNFKKVIALLLVLVMTFCYAPAIFAQEGEEPSVEYIYGTDGDFDYRIVIPEEGEEYAELVRYNGNDINVVVPNSFVGTDLKVIGHQAFYDIQTLREVTIPDGVEIIDSRSFAGCKSLTYVHLPDSVKEIGDYAFSGCYNKITQTDAETGEVTVTETGISFMEFPKSLEKIGDFAFQGCERLIGNGEIVSNVDSEKKVYALLLPVSLREIGADAFSQCRSLINVFIPEGVTEIKTGTFTNCADLERVEIPSTVKYIGAAFNGAFKSHNNYSENKPVLYIRAPHCIIVPSPDIDIHMVVYGAVHSSVQAYVDGVNKEREDDFFKDFADLLGTKPQIEYMQFEAIDIPGHDFYGTVTDPTCLEHGYTVYVCRQCEAAGYYADEELADIYVPHKCDFVLPLGHDYGDWVDATEAGCETIGSQRRVCARCNYTDYGIVPAKGHSYIYRDTTTCTTAGVSFEQCTRCGRKMNNKTHFAYGHAYNYDDPLILREYIPCDGSGRNGVDGIFVYVCSRKNYNAETGRTESCGQTTTVIKRAHPDADNDFYCDLCSKYIGTSDQTPDKICSCSCHTQVGFQAFLYKIRLFFWKLFGVNRICECSVLHY